MTVSSSDAYRLYGDPHKESNLALWYCPKDLLALNPKLPVRVYANRAIHALLTAALHNCKEHDVLHEITTFSGCFNIRNIRGGGASSLHSWGLAVDFNAAHNPLGVSRTQAIARGLKPFSEAFARCWEDTGWEWGGRWSRPDMQHFQPCKLP